MGVLDVGSVFDILDPSCRGYLTSIDVQQYDELLHTLPMCLQQVEASIRQVCSQTHGMVTRENFLAVLQDLERRRALEAELRWDFMGLDQSGTGQLPLRETLLLFSMAHGASFSMQMWNQFLKGRGENRDCDVYFDEVKVWLCDYSEGPPATAREMKGEEKRLGQLKDSQTQQELSRCIYTGDETPGSQNKQDYDETTKKLARRKFHRWEREGVEGLIYDDGVDHGEEVSTVARGRIGITEMKEALQLKYDLLRKKLFWDMLRRSIGVSVFNSLGDTEKIERFRQMQIQEKQMREEGFLDTQVIDLVGSELTHEKSLVLYIGELREVDEKRRNDMYSSRLGLRAKSKTDTEIDRMLRETYEREFKGPVSCGDMLVALDTRYLQEKEWILSKLRSDTLHKWTNKQLTTEYCLLVRQHMLCELEEELYPACFAVGIAERQQEYKPDRYTPDRLRQEQLAKVRLAAYKRGQKSKFPYVDAEGARERSKNGLELKLDVVKEVVWKHVMEREALTEYLHGPDFNVLKHSMQKMSDEQRNRHMITLRNQRNKWREYSAGYRASQKHVHIKVLQEGVALYFELTRLERLKLGDRHLTDDLVCMHIMADLQQKQDLEFYSLTQQIQGKTDAESLLEVKRGEQRARREEVYDNVAGVVLGTERWTEDERPFLDAVEAKYNALRHLLYCHVLQLEHGVSWHRLSDKERTRFIDRKSAEEVKLREAGQLETMVKLIERLPKDFGTLRSLMGEDRSEYGRRMKELNELTEQAAVTGKEVDPSVKDEQQQGQVKVINLLADMVRRAQVEEDALIAQLRTTNELSLQEKLVPLVQLKIEIRRAERQERFDIGVLSIGLMERINGYVQLSFRQKSDQDRLYRLAKARVECRRRRIEAGRHYRKELDESTPDEGDTMGWMEAYVRERDKKHREEREILLTILQDSGMEELTEAAKTMSDDEKHKRLAELQAKRNRMNMSNREHQDENVSILEEAAAIRFVIKKCTLEKDQKRELTVDEVSTSLLAEVQEVQEKEMAGAITRLGRMDYEDLKTARHLEIEARHWGSADNVVFVLTQYEGEAEDKVILQALENKYDVLRERLLQDNLYRDKDYMSLNDTEKHRKLVQLKLQEAKLRNEGKYDELARVVRIRLQGEDGLHRLLGETRMQYEKRYKRILAGIPSAEEEDDDSDVPENVFEMIQQRFESERVTLLAMIRGSSGVVLGGSQRQVVLVRLRYEKRQVMRETQSTSAALALGLAERQQPDVDRRNKTDRWRQERFSQLWLDTMKSQKWKDSNDVIKEGPVTELKNAVIERLEEKHRQELDLLLDLLKAKVKSDLLALAENMSEVEKQNKLEELKEKRAGLQIEKTKDQHALLIEATVYKRISRTVTLTFRTEGDGVQEHLVTLSLVTDLRERQYMETEQYLQKLLSVEHQELIILQTKIIQEKKVKVANNVAEVLLSPEQPKEAGEHQLVQALENKYDTLKDKILAEALIAQMGENEWQKLSERERQRKVIELRMKEKKLRAEGRIEEANKLLGNMLQDQEKLQRLMGVNREDYDMKLAQKLARRKQRLAEGFTEEEVSQLEADEQKKEGKKINILADLDDCFEKEKAALLKTLDKYQDAVEEQRVKQMELSRLKREQRKAREEEKFTAAALYISMARETEEKMTDHRQRQEELARERLNQKLKKRRQAMQTAEVPPPEDNSDEMGWQEAVTKEIEMKHAEEREVLIQLLSDPNLSKTRLGLRAGERSQQETRLEELRLLRNLWKQKGEKNSTDHMGLLKEACALSVELHMKSLAESGDRSDSALQVLLLANLQEHQDAEMNRVLEGLPDKSVESLRQMKRSHEVSRKQEWYENVAASLLVPPTGDMGPASSVLQHGKGPSHKDVMDALEAKYDTLTTKLLEKVLLSQIGEDAWCRLSPSERQARIVKLRIEDRRLRVEGKLTEAHVLFGDVIADPELGKTLGDSRSEQRRRKEERLRAKKQLITDRKQQELSLNEALLESMLDEQEKQAESNRKWNVLQQLQEHFDDERQVVEASLQACGSEEEAQRLRQLELARLTREQRRLAQEEDFRAAAAVLNIDGLGEARPNATSELQRQKALALARINARRKMTQQKTDLVDLEEDEKQRLTEQANIVSSLDAQDFVALQAIVLSELELKQTRERESLVEFIHGSQTNQEVKQWLNGLSLQDKKFELERLRQERRKWKTSCLQKLAQKMETNKEVGPLSTVEQEDLLKGRQAQNQTLLRATAIRLQVEKEDLGGAVSDDELAVKLLVDLQQKQSLEQSAVSRVALQQDEMRLKQLRDTQITSTREQWLDNLVSVLFSYSPHGAGEEEEEEAEPEPDSQDDRQLVDDLEEELKQQRQNIIDRLTSEGKSQELILEELKNLEVEHEARREALNTVINKQRTSQKARQEARKQTEANKEYEDEIAMQMSKISNREMSFIQKPDPRNKQGDTMSIKIQERREARRRAAGEDILSPPSTAGTDRKRSKSLPGMRREKTVLNVDLTDEKINETQKQLMRDVAARNRTIAMEQKMHEDRLQRRIQEMKQRRSQGVQEVMETMERQRSNLMGVQTDARNRQIQRTKEEVEERRRQMTRNLKEGGSKNNSKFRKMLAEAEETIPEAGEEELEEYYSDGITPREQRRKSEGDVIRLLSPSKMEMKRKMKPDYTEYDII